MTFDIHVAQTAAQSVKLTNTSGVTKGYNNGGVLDSDDDSGLIGSYEITVTWHEGVTTDQQKAAYGSSDVTLEGTTPSASTPANYIKLLQDNTDASDTNISSNHKVKVHVHSDGSLQLLEATGSDLVLTGTTKATGYFAVRAANTSGIEGYANKGAYSASVDYVFGDIVTYDVDETTHYWICNVATKAKAAWDSTKWIDVGTSAPADHSHDKITVDTAA